MTTSPQEQATAELIQREQERCRAACEGDVAALEGILMDDYTHTHATAASQSKAEWLSYVKGERRNTSRKDLKVRLYGDAAVMTGRQVNAFDTGVVHENEIIQVWVKHDGVWKLAAFQATRPGPPAH